MRRRQHTITQRRVQRSGWKSGKCIYRKKCVAIEGVKKEKTKGEKFDVYIHTSNLVVTSLNTEDKRRMSKLEGKESDTKNNLNNLKRNSKR